MKTLFSLGLAALGLSLAPFASADVIISNFAATTSVGTAFGTGASTQYKAFGFTMGANPEILDEVELSLNFTGVGPMPVVSIWSDNMGIPGAEIYTLDNPTIPLAGQADYIFTTGVSFTLAANTSYWLHVRSEPTTGPASL